MEERPPFRKDNVSLLSGAGNRTAASGVAWSGCASLRGRPRANDAWAEHDPAAHAKGYGQRR